MKNVTGLEARPPAASAEAQAASLPVAVLDRALFGLACLLVLFATLAYGGVHWWSLFALQAGASLMFLLWLLRQSLAPRLQLWKNPLYLPIAAFSALVIIQIAFSLTAYPYATQAAAAKALIYVLFFLVVSQSEEIRRRPTLLLLVLVAFGALLAIFSMIQSFTWNGKVYWVREVSENARPYGPFIDRNHYAALMEMLTPLALVLAFTGRRPAALRTTLAFAALLMGSTIFLSFSRGGMLALLAELVILGAWVFLRRRARWATAGLALLIVAMGLFLWWLDGSAVMDRFATLGDPLERGTAGIRVQVLKDSPRMLSERLLLGWGLGNFPTVYPQFRGYYSNRFTNAAHNDYLQILLETGILGLGFALFFLVQLYRAGLSRLAAWHHSEYDVVALAALLGSTGVLIHSFVEFPLQTPAIGLTFALLCALVTLRPSPGKVRFRAAEVTELPRPRVTLVQ